jgi:NADPH2:quinone reductase
VKHTRIIVTHYGGPDALQVVQEECPEPKAGEVRVRVLAAGVSLPDVLAREGVHPETPRVPYTPGWDLVGIVDQIGEGVSGFELGQTVAAMPISGCYAQYVRLSQSKFIVASWDNRVNRHGTRSIFCATNRATTRFLNFA